MTVPTRAYDRAFDWGYQAAETGVRRPGQGSLIPVIWAGLPLNSGELDNGLCVVIEDVEGWLDSPPVEGERRGAGDQRRHGVGTEGAPRADGGALRRRGRAAGPASPGCGTSWPPAPPPASPPSW